MQRVVIRVRRAPQLGLRVLVRRLGAPQQHAHRDAVDAQRRDEVEARVDRREEHDEQAARLHLARELEDVEAAPVHDLVECRPPDQVLRVRMREVRPRALEFRPQRQHFLPIAPLSRGLHLL